MKVFLFDFKLLKKVPSEEVCDATMYNSSFTALAQKNKADLNLIAATSISSVVNRALLHHRGTIAGL